jgi:oligopeptide transport system ATP-binding protein
MPLLEVQDLEVAFFTKDGVVRAVNGVSYTLDDGEILGIVGESGCGKSVSCLALLRLIPEPPARVLNGRALFEGRDLLKLGSDELRKVRGAQIAVIFQDPMTSLNPVVTIGNQIAEAGQVNLGLSRGAARKRAVEVLSYVGIPRAAERLDDYPHEFSGGMRQRVMIAMAISCEPRLLIADEPTTALDVTIQAQIVDLVRQLQQEMGMAVMWITHDLGVIARLARRVNVMYAGSIVEAAPIRTLFHQPAHPYALGLLQSVPRPDLPKDVELAYIDGAPPDMIRLPSGCPFHPRCTFARDRCVEEKPSLVPVETEHLAACWYSDEVRAASGVRRSPRQEA